MSRFLFRPSFLGALLCLTFAVSAHGVEPREMLSNPALEARARELSQELRCVVCQNQSIDDSNAELAHDMRVLVRKRIESGDSNQQVKQYLVDRYGDFVSLKPPFKAETYALWFGPPLFLLAAVLAARAFYRRRAAAPAPPLSDADKARLLALLKDGS